MKNPKKPAKKAAAKKPDKGQAARDRSAKGKSAAAGTKAVGKSKAAEPDVRKFPSRNTIKGVMDPVQTHLNRAATESGKARELIAEGKRTKGIDPEVFGYVRKLRVKGERDPMALRNYLDARAHYESEMGIEKLAGDSLFSYETAEDGAAIEDGADGAGGDGGESDETEGGESGGVVDLGSRRAAAAS